MTPPVVYGLNGMPRLELTHDSGSMAQIYLNGAHVTSWTPVGWHDMLYLSRLARFAPGVPIRGGIPVVFPQFADQGPLPRHGWLRTTTWQVAPSGEAEDSTHATLFTEDNDASRRIWPHRYRVELDVTIAERSLAIALSIFNPGPESFSFTSALHNYFFVADVRESHIEGLHDAQYLDKTDGLRQKTEAEEKTGIGRETDRIYRNTPSTVVLHDHASGTALQIGSTAFPDIVVWNPWEAGAKQISDMADEDYLRMICIEPALAVTPCVLAPGQRWAAAQELTVLDS
ncbi:MAG TPA: D-hexose-6-phosphate mutarotase [Gemmatimonadaceae bacterium]